MGVDMKTLQGLFNWSIQFQGGEEKEKPPGMSPEEYDAQKMKWLANALETYGQVQDPAARMRQIKMALDLSSGGSSGGTHTGAGAAAGAASTVAGTNTAVQQQAPLCLTIEDKEALLEELTDWVTSIDNARDLHTIGGLPTLLTLLDSSTAPSLRWRAAEVAATCMANNPAVQQWFLDGGLLPRLLALLDAGPQGLAQLQQHQRQLLRVQQMQQMQEQRAQAQAQAQQQQQQGEEAGPAGDAAAADAMEQGDAQEQEGKEQSDNELCAGLLVKGLLATSAFVRQCKPALELFRLEGGLLRLVNLAGHADSRVQRKAMTLLQYVLSQHPQDTSPAVQFGCIGPCVRALQEADTAALTASKSPCVDGFTSEQLTQLELAGAALKLLNEIARCNDGWQALKRQKVFEKLVGDLRTALASLPNAEYKASVEVEEDMVAKLQQALKGPPPLSAAALAPQQDHIDASQDQKAEGPVTLTMESGLRQDAMAVSTDSHASSGRSNMGLSVVPDNRF